MDTIAAIGDSTIRVATEEDIPRLACHHRLMFEEIQESTGTAPDPAVMAVLEKEYAAKLAREFKSGTCISWVAVDGDRIVASGAVSILQYVPVPHDLSCQVAFLHSVYTEKEYRHQHYASRITREAADFCRDRGIKRLYLFASNAGIPMYEKIGFVPVPNMMLLLQ
ncbi:GNAT family N-acetyltransferase [Methanoregula sp.]|uniref:GNAT family N-acetyltransferase n=1 Tax=Methanoregula sp. TaxID=2052170 RepID=UPI0025F62CC6|nr:GNAT family N-acetyltransferase [Methanoregula sp.]